MLHFSALAFIMTCLAIPVGGMLYSWIAKRFQPERIVVPDWNFGPEIVPAISRKQASMAGEQASMAFDRKPYDWTKEID